MIERRMGLISSLGRTLNLIDENNVPEGIKKIGEFTEEMGQGLHQIEFMNLVNGTKEIN